MQSVDYQLIAFFKMDTPPSLQNHVVEGLKTITKPHLYDHTRTQRTD
jgi:hypothetical protein